MFSSYRRKWAMKPHVVYKRRHNKQVNLSKTWEISSHVVLWHFGMNCYRKAWHELRWRNLRWKIFRVKNSFKIFEAFCWKYQKKLLRNLTKALENSCKSFLKLKLIESFWKFSQKLFKDLKQSQKFFQKLSKVCHFFKFKSNIKN